MHVHMSVFTKMPSTFRHREPSYCAEIGAILTGKVKLREFRRATSDPLSPPTESRSQTRMTEVYFHH